MKKPEEIVGNIKCNDSENHHYLCTNMRDQFIDAIRSERKVLEEKEAEVKDLRDELDIAQEKLSFNKKQEYSEIATVKDIMAKPDDYLERWISGILNRVRDADSKLAAQAQVIERMREALNWVTHLINGVSKNGSSEISTGEWEECNKRRQEILSPPAQSKEGEK